MANFSLSQDNRLFYGELLEPDSGYNLDFTVGMTYSMDLEALLGVPISLGFLEDMDSSMKDSPFYLLEAIRKSSDKIAIFCNPGGIKLPNKIQSVYSLLENSVFEVKVRDKKNFHPKLWILKYSNKEGHSYIKLIVMSRNLTFDKSLDISVALRGEIGTRNREKNRPIFDMLEYVKGFANKGKQTDISNLAADVLKVKKFEIDSPFEDYEFLPFGIKKPNEYGGLFDKHDAVIIFSPFLSNGILNNITQGAARKTLFTRKSSLDQNIIDSFDDVYIVKDIVLENELTGDSQSGSKQDIHAKIYFTRSIENGSRINHLYLGSANASHNAFYNNVEFLLKLQFESNMTGYEKMLKDFLPDQNNPFEKISFLDENGSLKEIDLYDKAIKEVIWAIKSAKVTESGNGYNIEVVSKQFNVDFKVELAPLQRKQGFEKLKESTVFKGLLLRELSEFYILKVDDKQVIVKIDTKGIPKERDDAIFKAIINSNNFLAYISFMLADNYSEEYFNQKGIPQEVLNGGKLRNYELPEVIYEKMLEAVASNPKKILEIEDIIKRLDNETVSEEFVKMYSTFKEIAKKVLK